MKTHPGRRNRELLRRIALAEALGSSCAWSAKAGTVTFSDDFPAGLRPGCRSVSQTIPGYFTGDASQSCVHLAKASIHNPGGLQSVGVGLTAVVLGGSIPGDFTAQVDFSQVSIQGNGLNQIELHTRFADGNIFFVVHDRSGGPNAHVWNGCCAGAS
jgi:hypothetical protein